MQKAALALLAILVLPALLGVNASNVVTNINSNNKINTKAEVYTNSTVNVYAELANFYLGKQGSMAYTLMYLGGKDIQMPINTSWSELEGLVALRIAGGVGVQWWLYYHHDIYPEIPPMITLAFVYNNTPESTAVARAKSLAEKIGASLGYTFKPFWTFEEDTSVIIIFTAEGEVSGNVTLVGEFMKNEIINKIPNEGLGVIAHSPVIEDNIDNGVYTRASFTLIRDINDVDNDTDTSEFIPVFFVASVVSNAFVKVDTEWYVFSLKSSMKLSSSYTVEGSPMANFSIFRVVSYLPLEIDETNSTVPDNPMYEYTGNLMYILKTPAVEKSYSDIYIKAKPFNFTEEVSIMPFVTSAFFIDDVKTEPFELFPYSGTALNITLKLVVGNFGKGTAVNVDIALPIVGYIEQVINHMIGIVGGDYSTYIHGPGWDYTQIEWEGRSVMALVHHVDAIESNSTYITKLNLILLPDVLGDYGYAIYFMFGPIVRFFDIENKQYFVFANGFAASLKAGIFVAPILVPKQNWMEPVNETEFRFRFNYAINLTVFAGADTSVTALNNVYAALFVSKPTGIMDMEEPRMMSSDFLYSLAIEPNQTIIHEFNLSFESILKAGAWTAFGLVSFKLRVSVGDGFRDVNMMIATNSYMIYIPPIKELIMRWISEHVFPYAHVELKVSKSAIVNNESSELVIRINITNIGDTATRIAIVEVLLTEYIVTETGDYTDSITVKINGEEVQPTIVVKEDLGVVAVVYGNIYLRPGETVTIEITVKLDANFTGDIVIRPTLIKYDFGKYQPERVADEESGMGEVSRNEGSMESGMEGSAGGGVLRTAEASLRIFEETNPTSTYSDALLMTVGTGAVSGTTEGEGEGETEGGGWGLIILFTIIATIIVIAYVIISKRNSSKL